ncbi:MAG: metallophosphoesterase [Candidatus Omnitrophica bacterium]|nr:metallophosphoesterase [Candidatus Omnitrophota bacterium]
MKVAWLTDIHLNFLKPKQLSAFLKIASQETADCFFVSGDIGEADSVVGYLEQMATVLKRPIYFVLGNHDYYGGSIEEVRGRIDALQKQKHLIWLNKVDYIGLSKETAIVGYDSWADGRLGDFEGSSVELNDFRFIDELKLWDRADRLKVMQKLADEAAEHLKRVLPMALKDHRHILVISHVPPFKEACWHEGQLSGDDWLPFFSCKVVGDILEATMKRHPEAAMTVLCGHTHGAGECQVLSNLKVIAGGAEYGAPKIQQVVEIK